MPAESNTNSFPYVVHLHYSSQSSSGNYKKWLLLPLLFDTCTNNKKEKKRKKRKKKTQIPFMGTSTTSKGAECVSSDSPRRVPKKFHQLLIVSSAAVSDISLFNRKFLSPDSSPHRC